MRTKDLLSFSRQFAISSRQFSPVSKIVLARLICEELDVDVDTLERVFLEELSDDVFDSNSDSYTVLVDSVVDNDRRVGVAMSTVGKCGSPQPVLKLISSCSSFSRASFIACNA